MLTALTALTALTVQTFCGFCVQRRISSQARKAACAATLPPACVSPPVSASSREDVVRSDERDTLRRWDRRRERLQYRVPAGLVDLPAQQHGVVLVHGVVAVLHEHAAEVPELQRDGHTSPGAQTIDVFAALLPWRHVARTPVAGKDLAFLEVDVDRVIPATAAVLQRPDLARAHLGRRRNPPDARVQHRPVVVRFDAPGAEADRRRIGYFLRAAPA